MAHTRRPQPGSKYYLPPYTYRMVVNFCLQYYEIKDELKALDGWHSAGNDGMPHGTNISDPTASDATRRAELQKKIDIIESSVSECASGYMGKLLLESITIEDAGYQLLDRKYGVPMGHRQFSNLRRQVYYNISKKI